MSPASLQTTSPARKRKPSLAHVVETFHREVAQRGKRGALRRTGDLLGLSDETVRRYVLAAEHAAQEKANEPDDLTYVPPPFGDELLSLQAQSRATFATAGPQLDVTTDQTPHTTPQQAPAECGSVMSSTRSDVANLPRTDDATRHSDERNRMATEDPELPHAPADDVATPHDDVATPHSEGAPGHARPDLDEPGAEVPELPPESFPNPQPNQPPPDDYRISPPPPDTQPRPVSPALAAFLAQRQVDPLPALPRRESRGGMLESVGTWEPPAWLGFALAIGLVLVLMLVT